MKRAVLAAFFLLGACATSSSSVVTAGTPSTLRIDSQGGTKEVRVGMAAPVALADNLLVSPEVAWARLPQAFAAVGLEGAVPLDAERTLVLGPKRVSRRLAGERMSRLLNCGEGLAAPNADTHSVMLTISTQVVPAGTASRLETRVQATATPQVSGGATVACSSTGVLENRIAAEMRKP
ncbi:MAG TPA: hypothetical protein VF710_25480 [Longimicrobium sp.]